MDINQIANPHFLSGRDPSLLLLDRPVPRLRALSRRSERHAVDRSLHLGSKLDGLERHSGSSDRLCGWIGPIETLRLCGEPPEPLRYSGDKDGLGSARHPLRDQA